MKVDARSRLLGPALGLILLTAAPSFAIILPVVNVANDGSVTVSAMSFNFPMDGAQRAADFAASTPNSFSNAPNYSMATPNFTASTPTSSADVATGAGLNNWGRSLRSADNLPLASFLRFPGESGLAVALDSFDLGKVSTDCTALSSGNSCSPVVGWGVASPVILSATSTGSGTLLSHSGTEFDHGTPVGSDPGNFGAAITPFTSEQTTSSDPFTQTSPSSTLTVTPTSATPEPRDISLVVIAGLLVGLVVKRRKVEA